MIRPETPPSTIKIIAGLISDAHGRVLLVRKRGTEFFMQPGGKIDDDELPMQTLTREIREELGCDIVPGSEKYLGRFLSVAANEPGYKLDAELYKIKIDGPARPMLEIEELVWIPPNNPAQLKLAPFTSECVLPIA